MTLLLLVALAVPTVSSCGSSGSEMDVKAPSDEEIRKNKDSWLGKGDRVDKDGWIILRLEGEPLERGFQYGHMLADEIGGMLRVMEYVTKFNTGQDFSYFIDQAATMFKGKIGDEYEQEMMGIATGAKEAGLDVTYEQILALNGYYDLTDYWWPTVKDNPPSVDNDRCSAFIATGEATRDGGIVMGHNDWSDFVIADYYNIILDISPSEGHRIVMQTKAGHIDSNTDFFVTDAGIVGTETTIGGFSGFNPEGTPEFVRMRKATQYADSVKQWTDMFKEDNNGAYANSWLLGDVNSNEIYRFEVGLKYTNLEKKSDGYFSGFNVATDPRIRDQECQGGAYYDYSNIKGCAARRLRWDQLMAEHYGQIDAEIGKRMLADHYDVYLEKENPSTRTICGHNELDACAVIPKIPFYPRGAVDGKVTDTAMAKDMSFWARWGCSCGTPFIAEEFLKAHQQYNWLEGYLEDRPSQPWCVVPDSSTGD